MLDPNSGVFSWTPTYGTAGTYLVHFAVSDGAMSSSQDVPLTVNHVNLALPDRCVDCSSGGSITDLTPGAQMRRLQFGLKLSF